MFGRRILALLNQCGGGFRIGRILRDLVGVDLRKDGAIVCIRLAGQGGLERKTDFVVNRMGATGR
jgi:hypothetical protein